MLLLNFKPIEGFDETSSRFVILKEGFDLRLEHSLVSLSKWEQIHETPFLGLEERSREQSLSYLECMVLGDRIPPDFYERLTNSHVEAITDYIDAPSTATTFGTEPEKTGPGEVVTSELIYYWMNMFQINWEAQYWHLNRLLALIRVHNVKSQKPKPRSSREIAAERARLNAERRAKYHTKG